MRMIFAFLALAPAATALADTWGTVRPEPNLACAGIKPHDICFDLPKDEIARAEYQSKPFYAVMLKTAARCSITEEERLETQALFPRNKVFSMRFSCGEDSEENIRYTNVGENVGFLAVYAGTTPPEAAKMLLEVQTTGRFQGANVRKMHAVLVYP